jgi:hypothetical protein
MGETVRSHPAWQLRHLVAVCIAGKTLGGLNFKSGPFSETEMVCASQSSFGED